MVWDLKEMENPRFTGEAWGWWLEDLSGMKPKSARNYVHMINGFLEHEDWTTEDLYSFHRENSKAEDTRERKRLASKVVEYQTMMMEAGKSSGTAELVEKALRSFFKSNEMAFKINGAKRIKRESKEIAGISKAQIKQVLEVCGSIRLIAASHFLKDSGMRISDAVEVKVSDVKEALEGDADYYTWELKQVKTGRMANPVLGPESISWLKRWMAERQRTDIESPYLFCSIENYGTSRTVGSQMDAGTLGALFRHYVKKAGISGVSIHSLRKYHKTFLEAALVPVSWINKMQGRVGQGTGGVYSKPNEDQLIKMFKQGYEELRLEGTADEETKNELADLRASQKAMQSLYLQGYEGQKIQQELINRMNAELKRLENEVKDLKKEKTYDDEVKEYVDDFSKLLEE